MTDMSIPGTNCTYRNSCERSNRFLKDSKKIKKNKLLLQTSVRKLHSDLIADVPEYTSLDGNIIVSDTKFRALIPPEVKRMTLTYKQLCGCLDCLSIDIYHEAYYTRLKDFFVSIEAATWWLSKGRSIKKEVGGTSSRVWTSFPSENQS